MSALSLVEKVNIFFERINELEAEDSLPRSLDDVSLLIKTFFQMKVQSQYLCHQLQENRDVSRVEDMNQAMALLSHKVQTTIFNSYAEFSESPLTASREEQIDLLVEASAKVHKIFQQIDGPIPIEVYQLIRADCDLTKGEFGADAFGQKAQRYLDELVERVKVYTKNS